jgi:SAM-dependent methyltransferase
MDRSTITRFERGHLTVQSSDVDTTREQRRLSFNDIADLYARARPSYPSALIDDVIRGAGLRPGSRILELGSGPGNATVLLSGRGFQIVGLEPGENPAAVARRRVSANADTQIVVTSFENWPIPAERFDLVIAAQSFHWMDPATRFSRSARALRDDGTLAVFANRPSWGTGALDLVIQDIYHAHAPHLCADGSGPGRHTREHFQELFSAATDFAPAECREYSWRAEYTAADYVDLLQTHSDHRVLPSAQLAALMDGIRAAIDAAGGTHGIDYVAVLCMAHRL